MWWLIILIITLSIYHFIIKPTKYWTKRGVLQTKPKYIFGDNWSNITREHSVPENVLQLYNYYPKSRYHGMYQFMIPTLMIRDPELIKQICVKDFEHFMDHRQFIKGDSDPIWTKNLFALTGQAWRDMRQTLSPTFTSSKMRAMFVLMNENAKQFLQYFLDKKSNNMIELEMKDTFTRFTNDVIASTAFGIGCDSLKNQTNEFYQMGKFVTDTNRLGQRLKFIIFFLWPQLSYLLGVKLFPKSVTKFFTNLVSETIRVREENGIIRPDLINLMMEAKKNGLKYEEIDDNTGFATVEESEFGRKSGKLPIKISDLDITAQALIFFFAGFDAVSSLMCFISYELGVNPEIQGKLYEEILDVSKSAPDEGITYELLIKMKYLDMIVCESLRKWPNVPAVDRVCTKTYTIKPENFGEKSLIVDVNTPLFFPIYGLHRDPEYFPDPDRFDPERFNDDNKKNIKPYTYLPFGIGPRNCIGSRFALLETKLIFYYLLLHFEIIPIDKTPIPFKFHKTAFNLNAENGFWLGLKRRIS